jgi:beta-lactamase regulating signal transducer with metallopeptidase domain
MTLTTAAVASSSLLLHLAVPALRAMMLAGIAALGLFALRIKATPSRLFTWTVVLYAALAMPLLGWILPSLPVPAPAFLQNRDALRENNDAVISSARNVFISSDEEATRKPSTMSVRSSPSPAKVGAQPSQEVTLQARVKSASSPVSPSRPWFVVYWRALTTGIYLLVAAVLSARIVIGIVLGHRLIRSSQEVRDARVMLRLASRSNAHGLRIIPAIAESELISVPVTLGVIRPTILLPIDWQEWDNSKLDAVIVHEVSHVARHDALTQRLSLLHRAIFWFSPLVWWLDRHLADLAEQASDEAALSCGAERNAYAKTLLGFFEALQTAPGRVWWQGVSMAKTGQAEKRLERILAWKEATGAVAMGFKNSGLKKSIAVAVITLAIPVVYVAAAVRPVSHNQRSQSAAIAQDQTTPASPASSTTTALPATAAAPQDAPAPSAYIAPDPALTPVAPSSISVRPVAPMASLAPRALFELARQQQSPLVLLPRHNYLYRDDDDEQRFVIVSGKSDSLTMSGTLEDARHAKKLKKQIAGDFIWFERDEKSYIIRDQATVDRARKLWAPQEELGKKQEELGKQQAALGKQQQALGSRMEQVQVKVPDMTTELDKLKAELKALSAGATMEQVGRVQSEIGELQSKVGELQSQAGGQQSKLGEEMSELGAKQAALGAKQAELGDQQEELARKAVREMKELLDEAIKNGTAKPEPETGTGASL